MAQTVAEIMARTLVTLPSDSSITDAARRMRDEDIGDVIVLDNDQLRGIVTDRDITVRAVADGRTEATLGEICSTDLVTASPTDDLGSVMQKMEQAKVRRIPVVENGRPVGIVSLGDLAIQTNAENTLSKISAARGNT
jgi:CBS domain-containing protein